MSARRSGKGIRAILGLLAASAIRAGAAESADETARRCLEHIRLGQRAEAVACFAPDARPANMDSLLAEAQAALQLGTSVDVVVVNRNIVAQSGRTEVLVYHVRGEAKALLVLAQTREDGGAPALIGLRWEPAPLDLADRHPFTLAGVPLFYYVVLAAAVALPIFMLAAAVVCFRRRPPRRWLWILFILLGFGKLSVVWVPGPLRLENVRYAPLNIQLLGASIFKLPIYDPWVISVSIPVGAAIFLWGRRGRSPADKPPPA